MGDLLDTVNGVKVRKEMKSSLSNMFNAFKAAFPSTRITFSGYRAACPTQYTGWLRNFGHKYKQRCQSEGKSVSQCVRYVRGVYAAPGFSNHNAGWAVDFRIRRGSLDLGASTSKVDAWRRTAEWAWLRDNGESYDMKPLSTEPWHWAYDPAKRPTNN